MNRRGFIKSIAALAAVAAAPVKWAYGKIRHRLHGDGVADDTEALQALLDGERVEMPDGTIQKRTGDTVCIPPGTYRVTSRAWPFK